MDQFWIRLTESESVHNTEIWLDLAQDKTLAEILKSKYSLCYISEQFKNSLEEN